MRIAIVSVHLILGGVERALVNLVKELVKVDGASVVLFLARKSGPLLREVPESVEIREIPLDAVMREALFAGGFRKSLSGYLGSGKIREALELSFRRLLGDPVPELLGRFGEIEPCPERFDLAVAFHLHMPFLAMYALGKLAATRKALFVHNDIKGSGFDVSPYRARLKSFDSIYAVSEGIRKELDEAGISSGSGRVEVFHNLIDVEDILKKSVREEPEARPFPEGALKILTVGRLESQKGIDLAIRALSLLVSRGMNARWYVIGTGSLEWDLRELARTTGVGDKMVFLGALDNPYPYIRKCDVYVQPSRHEGWGLVVQEAMLLRKPVIVTDAVGLREQVIDGINGKKVPIDPDKIAEAIEYLAKNPGVMREFEAYLSDRELGSDQVDSVRRLMYGQEGRSVDLEETVER
jgi:glycosyltransferase involved in cell wall biosynthesis